eukprot:scaffold138393_cov21-Tisochrysis_lutea.AAC.2
MHVRDYRPQSDFQCSALFLASASQCPCCAAGLPAVHAQHTVMVLAVLLTCPQLKTLRLDGNKVSSHAMHMQEWLVQPVPIVLGACVGVWQGRANPWQLDEQPCMAGAT